MPPIVFYADRVGTLIRRIIFREDPLPPLPSNIKKQISSIVPVPRNVVFMRGEGNDCRSVSFFVVHIVILPKYFEEDLANPDKQARLLHEFAHGRFTDYLSVIWISFTFVFVAYVTFQLVWAFDGGEVQKLIASTRSGFTIGAPLFVLLLFCLLDAAGILHRREVNADFGAFHSNPQLFRDYLERLTKNSIFYKTEKMKFDVIIINWLLHPSYERRLSIITGRKKIQSLQIFLPAILAGFCPAYIVFILIGSLYSSTVLDMRIASAISIPLSIFCLIQLGNVFNEIFGRNTVTDFTDRLVFWLGLLVGYEFFALAFFYTMNSENGGELVITAINNQIVTMQLSAVLIAIFLGHALFAIHSKLCVWIFGPTVLGVFATPIYSIAFFSLLGGVQMTEDLNTIGILYAFSIVIIVGIFVMLLFEMVTQKITASTIRIFQSLHARI